MEQGEIGREQAKEFAAKVKPSDFEYIDRYVGIGYAISRRSWSTSSVLPPLKVLYSIPFTPERPPMASIANCVKAEPLKSHKTSCLSIQEVSSDSSRSQDHLLNKSRNAVPINIAMILATVSQISITRSILNTPCDTSSRKSQCNSCHSRQKRSPVILSLRREIRQKGVG